MGFFLLGELGLEGLDVLEEVFLGWVGGLHVVLELCFEVFYVFGLVV